MTNNIPQHYILKYDSEIKLAYQFEGGKVFPVVQSAPQSGEGAAPADFVGPMVANLNPGRLSATASNSASVTRRWVYPNYFDLPLQFDKRDATRVFSSGNLMSQYAKAQGVAMARMRDDLLVASMFATAVTGKNGGSTTTFPAGQIVAPNYKAAANTGLTAAKLIRAKKLLQAGGVDIDRAKLYCVINSDDHEFLLNQIEIRSKDYNNKAILDEDGFVKNWLGINFLHMEYSDTTQYPLSSTANVVAGTRYVPVFDAAAMYWGNWSDTQLEQTIRGDLMNATQMYTWAEGGPTRLQELGMVRVDCV